jgi:GNAT superfamily N-acetyltransferase
LSRAGYVRTRTRHNRGVRIRHVRADEAAAVRALRLRSLAEDPDAFGSTYERDAAFPATWWERIARLSAQGTEQRTFVAVDDDDRWVGLALVRPDDDDPPAAVLNAMWVAPEARGRGAARALCEACVAWAAEHGFPALNAAVVVGNAAAQRTYESAGFVPARRSTYRRGGRSFAELVLTRRL